MCAAPPQKSRVQGRRHACVWECIATATGTRQVERPIRLLITSRQSTTARPIEVEWLESLHPQPRHHLQGLESHGMHHLLTRGAERAGRDALDAWKRAARGAHHLENRSDPASRQRPSIPFNSLFGTDSSRQREFDQSRLNLTSPMPMPVG